MEDSKVVLESTRAAILETLPTDTSLHGAPLPSAQFLHLPGSHVKALDPDASLVVGMRGAGKSFWWAALQHENLRRLIALREPRLREVEQAIVHVGYGERHDPEKYPPRDVCEQLLTHRPANLIWRTVVLNALGYFDHGGENSETWPARVDRVADHPEQADRFLFNEDRRFAQQDRYVIVLFDALDRSARSWQSMNQLISGLLEVALDVRPYRRLRVKCFLRSDQLDEREVAGFPDSSKLLSAKVDLRWPPFELYGMLFQYLGRVQTFREESCRLFPTVGEWQEINSVWIPSKKLLHDEKTQRAVFEAIAGKWMGRDARRGIPYTWVPNHLGDARGEVSPRSFLAALRAAAEDSQQRYPDHPWALHYESIKRGVQAASKIRVRELKEDYSWVDDLMNALRGLVVPCSFDSIAERWHERQVIRSLGERVDQGEERLPPAHLDRGAAGVREDLELLGIFQRLADGRVNIPDVYRVGYGLGRHGGVKPVS
ncbi:MAG: hypothetical protein HRF46_10760 [Acidobacteriota bacterium]|jgi:hypothetical protein